MKSPLHKVLDRVYRFPHNADMHEVFDAVYGPPNETNRGYIASKRDLLVRKGFAYWWCELDLANQRVVCDMMERKYGEFSTWTQ